ncbi:MAG TPA: transposase [Mogibacterium sp.]|nr:transposase [Mogibacterium sp.]
MDSFHVIKLINHAFNLVRCDAITGGRYIQATDLIKRLLSIHPELEVAYYHKENYAYFNKASDSKNAAYRLDQFIIELSASGISEFQPVKRSLRKWRKEIVNSFDRHNGKRISNGSVESVNSRLKLIKRNGKGYKDFERFRKRALYSLNNNSSIKL